MSDGIAQGRLKGRETVDVKITLELGGVGLTKTLAGKIALE